MKLQIIGLGHCSGVGKSTLARALTIQASMTAMPAIRYSVARPLKEAAYQMFKQYGMLDADSYEGEGRKLRNIPLPRLNMTPIQVWNKLGTDVAQTFIKSVWVDKLIHDIQSRPRHVAIIDDIRFMHEVDAIRQCGGDVVKITRLGIGPTAAADFYLKDYQGWHSQVSNDSDVETAVKALLPIMCQICDIEVLYQTPALAYR